MAYTSNIVPPTPKYSSLSNSSGSLGYTSPASTALNNVQSGNTTPPAPSWQSTLTSFLGNTPPSTSPIKKIVGPDGSEIHYDNTGILGGVGQSKNTGATYSHITSNNSNTGNQNNLNNNSGGGNTTVNTNQNSQQGTDPAMNSSGQVYNSMTGTWATPQTAGSNATINSNGQVNSTPSTSIPDTFGGTTTGLINSLGNNQTLTNNANAITSKYAGMINPITRGAIGQETGDLTTGTAPVGEGNSAVAASAAGNLIQGLTNQENQELAGNSQGITAQGQTQSGLGTAAGLVQPSPTAQGQTTYDPVTNSFSGGSYPTNLATVVQAIKSGNMGYTTGVNSLASLSPTAKADVLAALGPGFDTVASDANAATKGSNISTAGTAGINAANTGYSSALQDYNNANASYTALTGISNQVISTLSDYANTGTLTDMNAAINTLQGQLSNPDYQKFITAIGNAQASYQGILGSSGVTPTKADQDAVSALNPSSSASTIVAALNQLSSDAHALIIAPNYQKVQSYEQQLGINQ